MEDEDDWGCEYCRNDGRLVEGRCPKCDAQYPDEESPVLHDQPRISSIRTLNETHLPFNPPTSA